MEHEEDIIVEEEIMEQDFPHDIVRTMYEFLGLKNVMKGQYFLISSGWFDTFDEYCTNLYEVDIHEASTKDSKQLISILRVQRLLRILQKTKRFKNTETANFIFGDKYFHNTENKIHLPLTLYDQGTVVTLQGIVDSLSLLNNTTFNSKKKKNNTPSKKCFKISFGDNVYAFEAIFEEDSYQIFHTPGKDTDPSLFTYNPVTFQNVLVDFKQEEKNPILTDTLFNLEFQFISNTIYVNLNDNQIFRFKRINEHYNTCGIHPNEICITTNNILWVRSLTVSYPMELLVQNEDEIDE
eukprot:gene8165-12625_t